MLEQLKQKGLTLYFLPPYSPGLNRIQILWRKVKYEWLACKTCDSKTLQTDLDDIFARFGEHRLEMPRACHQSMPTGLESEAVEGM